MTCRLELNAIAVKDLAVRITGSSPVLNPAATLICRAGRADATFFTYTRADATAQTAVLTATMGTAAISTNIVLAPKTTSMAASRSVDSGLMADAADGELSISRVVSAASGSELACSSGSLAAVVGTNLAVNPEELPEVLINGTAVPVVAALPSRILFQCPSADPGTTLEVVVRNTRGTSRPVQTTAQKINPGIFTLDGSGAGVGRIGRVGTEETATVAAPGILGVPVQTDDVISILVTGTGDSKLVAMVDGIAHDISEIASVEVPGVRSIVIRLSQAVRAGAEIPVHIEAVDPSAGFVRSNEVYISVLPVVRQ
jgi:uncharacterized protein (TIGR03437 family)